MNCPCCNQPLPDTDVRWDPRTRVLARKGEAVKLSGIQARVFDVLWRAQPERVPTKSIFERVYADDPDGGPESPNIVAVVLCRVRKMVAPLGVEIKGRSWDGSKVEVV